jgi:hypothetical protein
MITLNGPSDFFLLFLVTAGAGMLGGFAAELLLTRNGETGAFELPARKGAVFDLGGFAPVLVGAVVGVAILVVFPPETTIVANSTDGSSTTTRGYDVVRLVATSLVAGSAGGTVLSGLQARVSAAVNESRVQFTAEAAKQQIDRVLDSATVALSTEEMHNASAADAPQGRGARPRGALSDPGPGGPVGEVAPDARPRVTAETLTADLRRVADSAKAAVDSAASTRLP